MKSFLSFLVLLLLVAGCHSHSSPVRKLTVIYYNNENPGYRETIDTLMKAESVDISKTAIDLYFASRHFPIPEFMPTDSLRRAPGQLNECNVKLDSLTSKCYQYDEKYRVVQMIIRHKSTLHQYAYTYDENGRVSEINSIDHEVYTPVYNSDGTLQELTKKGEFLKKRLVFLYD
ncbi:MAG TPA: hypothetical protein VK644_14305 [Chitinophagaceae bacterium]|nr:hypothetical protein [Chitinophagaceae bacterium]